MSTPLPPSIAANVRAVFGDRGDAWLDGFDDILSNCLDRWSLTLGDAFDGSFVNFVGAVTCVDGSEAVLKLGVPDAERVGERNALLAYAGDGAVRLLESNDDGSCLLLERIRPGTVLRAAAPDEAARIGGALMRRLWREPSSETAYVTVDDWMRGFDRMRTRFDGDRGPIPPRLVDIAESAYRELSTEALPVLLHGDFHHDNVLRAEREPWLVIDPKGVVGPPGFDCGAFLANAVRDVPDDATRPRILERQIDILAETTGLDREIVRSGSIVHGVLAAWWDVEDGGDCAARLRYLNVLTANRTEA